MATTTNYGWTTPDNSGLVKNGAQDIRTLGSSIDTTTKALNPSTTLGDIEYRSSTANTNTRLAIGTTGQVLTVSGGVPAWATAASGGAYTSLVSGSITNGLSLTSISGSYTDLYLVLTNFAPTVTDIIGIRINNDATSANYVGAITRNITGGTGASVQANSWAFVDVNSNSSVKQSTTGNSCVLHFANYANTAGYKIVTAVGGSNNNLSTYTSGINAVTYLSTSAITRLDFKTAGSDWANQGTYTLYGVK